MATKTKVFDWREPVRGSFAHAKEMSRNDHVGLCGAPTQPTHAFDWTQKCNKCCQIVGYKPTAQPPVTPRAEGR